MIRPTRAPLRPARVVMVAWSLLCGGAGMTACAGRGRPVTAPAAEPAPPAPGHEATTAPTSAAPLPGGTPSSLAAMIDGLLATRTFRNAQWGVLIVDPTSGDTLYSRNAGKLFVPASNQKIFTAATALTQLGPAYQFTTRFAATGAVRDSTLHGDVMVVGTGDPSFSDSMRAGDYRNAFRDMADSLARHGIRRITGALRASGEALPGTPYGAGWEIEDQDAPFGAGIGALFVNEGRTRAMRRNAAGDSVPRDVAIRDPAGAFLTALRDALRMRGITVDGAVDTAAVREDPAWTTLFTLRSPPLRDILPRLLKPSQNQIAEILFRTVGRETLGAGTADSGRRAVERQLLRWHADTDGFVVRDGSGLSRHDFTTPETLVRVLDAMRHAPEFAIWYDALPIAGVDGTLATRLRGTAAERKVHAKTGTLDKARALSGYVTTADGRQLLFAFLCNNFTAPSHEVERVQDAILIRLATSPRH